MPGKNTFHSQLDLPKQHPSNMESSGVLTLHKDVTVITTLEIGHVCTAARTLCEIFPFAPSGMRTRVPCMAKRHCPGRDALPACSRLFHTLPRMVCPSKPRNGNLHGLDRLPPSRGPKCRVPLCDAGRCVSTHGGLLLDDPCTHVPAARRAFRRALEFEVYVPRYGAVHHRSGCGSDHPIGAKAGSAVVSVGYHALGGGHVYCEFHHGGYC